MATSLQSSTRNREMMNLTLCILVAVMLLSGLPTTESHLIGFDCTAAKTIFRTPFSVIIPACQQNDEGTSYTVDAALVYKNDSDKNILLRQCTIRYKEFVEGASHLMSPWTNEFIDRESCLRAHETEKLDIHGETLDLKITGTRKRLYMIGGKARDCSEGCQNATMRDYEITLSTYMALVHVPLNIIKIKNMDVYCDYNNFQCDLEGKKLFWKKITEDCESDYAYVFKGRFEMFHGLLEDSYAVAEIENYRFVFRLSSTAHILCSELAYGIPNTDWNIVGLFGEISSIPKVNFDIGLFGNCYYENRVDYKDSAKNAIVRSCKSRQERQITYFQKLAEGERLETVLPGYVIERSGSDIISKQCLPVMVRPSKAPECYDTRITIFDQFGREMFLKLPSRIIVENAKIVPCARENKSKPKVVPTSELEDIVSFVTYIGAVSSGLWSMRFVLQLVSKYFWLTVRRFRPVPLESVERRSESRFMRVVNQFFELIRPPFY